MLIRRITSRGREKLNDWVTLLVDEENIMNNITITRHCGKRQKSKEKSKTMQMPATNKLWKNASYDGQQILVLISFQKH
jgi:hypothetical protein